MKNSTIVGIFLVAIAGVLAALIAAVCNLPKPATFVLGAILGGAAWTIAKDVVVD